MNTILSYYCRSINWIGHILQRNCLLKHAMKGKMEVTGRRGRTRKQLLDDLKERIRYWKLKKEALDQHCLENSLWKRLWTCRKTTWWQVSFRRYFKFLQAFISNPYVEQEDVQYFLIFHLNSYLHAKVYFTLITYDVYILLTADMLYMYRTK
jgi:hypothetical protein